MDERRRALLDPRGLKRVVVKLGSSTLTHPRRGLREEVITGLAEQVASLADAFGTAFVVVSSGAIAAGRKALRLEGRLSLPRKQAAAAVGQTALMEAYERAFGRRGFRVGQVLLTHADLEDRQRYVNARHTIETLIDLGVVPVINENDTVSTDEIRLGDNDHLAALVTLAVDADLLVLLTDRDGVYTADPSHVPDAERVRVVDGNEGEVAAGGTRAGSGGSGGMASKLASARLVAARGVPVVIASGHAEEPLEAILGGADVGTLVAPSGERGAPSRKLWIAHARRPMGEIVVDEGARRVLEHEGRSLLPAGIHEVHGAFVAGDVVSLVDPGGATFARGITGWTSHEVRAAAGKKSPEVRALLGEGIDPEVIHRDNLTLLAPPGARTGSKEETT